MIYELSKDNFTKVSSLHDAVSHNLVIKSVLAGHSPGRVWINDIQNPSSSFLWEMVNGMFYLAGDSTNAAFNEDVNSLLKERVFPELTRLNYDDFNLVVTPASWQDQIWLILKDISPRLERIQGFVLRSEKEFKLPQWRDSIPPGFLMQRITRQILDNNLLENREDIEYCVKACWSSIDRYLDHGIGYCLLHENVITSWCSTDFVIADDGELYVETFGQYQNKGFGTLCAAACVAECLTQQYTLYWHCWADHFSSIKIAQKVGFEKTFEDSVYSISL
ncbi:GNAT family N-acetyltransferase [candidate division CSSED10-310 bacterium]|uniref:GNAT family N-acetyltransferase n=1 Tax=candidate division CSSED10-310 bacterium TaxID=2855610 RepID=A0ABV6Z1H5_UNCC1